MNCSLSKQESINRGCMHIACMQSKPKKKKNSRSVSIRISNHAHKVLKLARHWNREPFSIVILRLDYLARLSGNENSIAFIRADKKDDAKRPLFESKKQTVLGSKGVPAVALSPLGKLAFTRTQEEWNRKAKK